MGHKLLYKATLRFSQLIMASWISQVQLKTMPSVSSCVAVLCFSFVGFTHCPASALQWRKRSTSHG
jgi:hypothetical protein